MTTPKPVFRLLTPALGILALVHSVSACNSLFGIREHNYEAPDIDAGTGAPDTEGGAPDTEAGAPDTEGGVPPDDAGAAGDPSASNCAIDSGGLAGRLDPSFLQGFKPTSFVIYVRAATIDSAGRIYILGSTENCASSTSAWDMTVLRFTNTGQPDPAFGGGSATGGRACPDFGATNEEPLRIVLDSHERIIVVGAAEDHDDAGQPRRKVAIARLTRDGVVDTTFNAGGPIPGTIRLTPPNTGGLDFFEAWAAQADDDGILVAGANGGAFDPKSAGFLFKLRDDGTLDASFPGLQDLSVASFAAIAKTTNGVLAAGNRLADGAFIVRKLSKTGAPDHNFGDGGIAAATATGEVRSMLVEPNGDIVVAGHVTTEDSSGQFVRFSSGGIPQNTHYTSKLHFDGVYNVDGIVRQCDGKLLLGGDEIYRKRLGVDRVNAGGALDVDYGVSGTAFTLATASEGVGFNSLMLDPRTNAAVVVGGRNRNDGPEIYRVLP